MERLPWLGLWRGLLGCGDGCCMDRDAAALSFNGGFTALKTMDGAYYLTTLLEDSNDHASSRSLWLCSDVTLSNVCIQFIRL